MSKDITIKAASEFNSDADYLEYCKQNETDYSRLAERFKLARLTRCNELVSNDSPTWTQTASDGSTVSVTLSEPDWVVCMDKVFAPTKYTPLHIGNWIRAHNITLTKAQLLDFLAYMNEIKSEHIREGKSNADLEDLRQPKEIFEEYCELGTARTAKMKIRKG